MSARAQQAALKRLLVEYKALTSSWAEDDMFVCGPVNEDDMFVWECFIKGPEDTPFEGGVFVATLIFPKDYPLNPPKMKFVPALFHPNIYSNGEVCISILHAPGDDPNHYETAAERWSPVQSIEKILLSVVSMLAGALHRRLEHDPVASQRTEPNIESGANIDASKMYRDDRKGYEAHIRRHVRQQLGL